MRVRRLGLRAGAGYGNFVLPRLRVVSPRRTAYATFDLFARFE